MRWRRACREALAVAFLGGAFISTATPAAHAAVHALVIGIDLYRGPPELKGAVNDAKDVSAALIASGAATVTVLLDGEATRERVYREWEALIEKSDPGDLLIFHFAGHGINEPDIDGDEEDGLDESYLLAGYHDDLGPQDRLIDDELQTWLAQAGAAGRKVLFIADACHSGTPTRSLMGETLPVRFYIPRTEPERPPPLAPTPVSAPPARDYVYSVGATLDHRTVPEIMIGDQPRGALSYAVARAFEGGADLDGDGIVSAGELETFVRTNVRNVAASAQTPQFDIPDTDFAILSRLIGVEGTGGEPTAAPEAAALRLHLRPGADPRYRTAAESMADVVLVDSEAEAHLVFDPATGGLLNATRDVVVQGLDPAGLAAAIDAQLALTEFQRLALHGTLPITLSPDDAAHPEGSEIGFTVPDVGGAYLTVFDLTGAGTIQYLWPLRATDSDPLPPGGSYTLEAAVVPPFGTDNLIVLATAAPPTALRATLQSLDGGRDTAALAEGLRRVAAEQPYRLGIQAFVTRPR
jgi:hypothetical protein